MRKLPLLLLLLLLSPVLARAAGPDKSCPGYAPSQDPAHWYWMDRECKLRTRADLEKILADHKLWLKKYAASMSSDEALDHNGAYGDPLRADLSKSHLRFADLRSRDLTRVNLGWADLSGAHMEGADLSNATADGTDFTDAWLSNANLANAIFQSANLIRAALDESDLTDASLISADLTDSRLDEADLSEANLGGADLSGASLGLAALQKSHLDGVHLTHAALSSADLTDADLSGADFTSANLSQADLSGTYTEGTDFSQADFTQTAVWYAEFVPIGLPLAGTISASRGWDTVRWFGPTYPDELNYRTFVQIAQVQNCPIDASGSSVNLRWRVWLSRYREILAGQGAGWPADLGFLWDDFLYGLQPPKPHQPPRAEDASFCKFLQAEIISSDAQPDDSDAVRAEYQITDLRNALRTADHTAAALEVNLAYQRHTQPWWKMIIFDWTCAYGQDPVRPLIVALVLAILAVPLYWGGFRYRWMGVQLLRVETIDGNDTESLQGDPAGRPPWRSPLSAASDIETTRVSRLLAVLRLRRPLLAVRGALAPFVPRLLWEASFVKAVTLFSFISVVNLGFDGFDFGRWVRMLFCTEYDLKARGWWRALSGLQSLVGLGLLALSLLSFFGHPFD